MLAFVFPGQGSQVKGMGAALFDSVPQFTRVESQVNDLLGFSPREACLNNPNNMLKQTQYTQPCLYIVNALHYYDAIAAGEKPAMLAGHSLGEYNALLAAGAFDFLTGLKLVKKRGELMSRASGGGMAAVIGLPAEQIQATLLEHGLSGIDVANYNSPNQTVISGPSDNITQAGAALDEAGAQMCVQLPVSAAFHSRYMTEAAKEFADYVAQFSFSSLRVPVVANVTARPYEGGDIASPLIEQIAHPVRWTQSIQYLSARGVSKFEEIGPGAVLTRLIQQIRAS